MYQTIKVLLEGDLVDQCPEALPSSCDNWIMKSSSGAKGPQLRCIYGSCPPSFLRTDFFAFSHPQLSLLLHAVAHLCKITESKVIRFFTLAQYTFIQTIIPVSFSHLNQIPPSPPGCGLAVL